MEQTDEKAAAVKIIEILKKAAPQYQKVAAEA
jgi:hypothetical protein